MKAKQIRLIRFYNNFGRWPLGDGPMNGDE